MRIESADDDARIRDTKFSGEIGVENVDYLREGLLRDCCRHLGERKMSSRQGHAKTFGCEHHNSQIAAAAFC